MVILILILLIVGIIVASSYYLGLIPNTNTYYEKRFNDYYLSLLSSTDCNMVRNIVESNQDDGFINYISNNTNYIEQKYPRDLLKLKINPLNCTYSDGTPIEF